MKHSIYVNEFYLETYNKIKKCFKIQNNFSFMPYKTKKGEEKEDSNGNVF